MKRLLLLIAIFLAACEPLEKPMGIIEGPFLIRDGVYFKQSTNKHVTGEIRTFHENGQLHESAHFRDGIKTGLNEFFSDSGLLSVSVMYKNGLKEGIEERYNSDGALRWVITNAKDKRNGPFVYYKNSGGIYHKTEGHYLNDVRHGSWTSFYPDGKKGSVSNYLNGKSNGVFETYKTDGQVVTSWECEKGKPANIPPINDTPPWEWDEQDRIFHQLSLDGFHDLCASGYPNSID